MGGFRQAMQAAGRVALLCLRRVRPATRHGSDAAMLRRQAASLPRVVFIRW